jgi:hypothetical protein
VGLRGNLKSATSDKQKKRIPYSTSSDVSKVRSIPIARSERKEGNKIIRRKEEEQHTSKGHAMSAFGRIPADVPEVPETPISHARDRNFREGGL